MDSKKNLIFHEQKLKLSIISFVQTLYLTVSLFVSNSLISYASACAFSFLFSFIPVIMMVLVILVRFLHTSPEIFLSLLPGNSEFLRFLNLEKLIDTIQQIKTVTNFEIITGLAIVWMARRFFSSVNAGINKIFRQEIGSKPLFTQILSLILEAVFTIVISVLIFAVTLFKTVFKIPQIDEFLSQFAFLRTAFSAFAIDILPYIIIFVLAALSYREISQSKPPLMGCLFAAFLCTATFFLFQKFSNIFINVNKYNLIYGVLSNTLVLLMELFFFFLIFLFFAQYLFVYQFFDTLVFAEMYLLPEYDDTNPFSILKRLLFIRPQSLLKKQQGIISCREGETIYSENQEGTSAYYIISGSVKIFRTNNVRYAERGSFFGEEACLLNDLRHENAVAETDVKLVKIPEEHFYALLQKNPDASKKALSQISNYFAKFYGRSTNNSL